MKTSSFINNLYSIIYLATLILFSSKSFSQDYHLIPQNGHSNTIKKVCYHPENKIIASAGADNTVKFWEIKTGNLLHTLTSHKNLVSDIEFSPDGKKFISSSYDKNLILIDIEDFTHETILAAHTKGIVAVTINKNSTVAVSADLEGNLIWWNLETGKNIFETALNTEITDICFADANLIVSLSNGTIRQIDGINAKTISTYDNFEGYIVDIQHNIITNRIVALTDKGAAMVFDNNDFSLEYSISSADYFFQAAAFSPTGDTVFCSDKSGFLHFYTIGNNIEVKKIESAVRNISVSNNGKNLLAIRKTENEKTIFPEDEIIILSIKNANIQQSIINQGDALLCTAISSDNNWFAAAGKSGIIHIWNFYDGSYKQIAAHNQAIESLAFSPKTNILASGAKDKKIKIWNIETSELYTELTGHTENICALDYRADGKYLASADAGGCVKFWEIKTYSQVRNHTYHTKRVQNVAISPDGKLLASVGWDNKTVIFDIENNKQSTVLKHSEGECWAVAWSPDGKMLATAGVDMNIYLWNTTDYKLIKKICNHTDYVQSLNFSPDGKFLISGSWDKTAVVYDIENEAVKYKFDSHLNYVKNVLFTTDGKNILTTGADSQIKIWNFEQGVELLSIFPQVEKNSYIIYTPQGYFDSYNSNFSDGLHYAKGSESFSIELFFETYYIPDLWQFVMSGDADFTDFQLKNFTLPPEVRFKISSLETNGEESEEVTDYKNYTFRSEARDVEICIEVTDLGGGIDEIALYHNNKLIELTGRGFVPVVTKGKVIEQKYNIALTPGENIFEAVAWNKQRTESERAVVSIFYTGSEPAANLYTISIGMNNYLNQELNLNYSVNDAREVLSGITSGGSQLFDSIYSYFIVNEEFTKEKCDSIFSEIIENAKSTDVFVLYYAGHGVSSEELNNEFFIIPYDVVQLYGDTATLREKALSATELRNYSRKIKAEKQLFIFDACQSGSATDNFLVRGGIRQKAIEQLARSAGIGLITASGSDQFANEAKELEHGIFTYALLEILTGKNIADESSKKVSISEIKAYLDERVPELSRQYKGKPQYPTAILRGHDFPLVLISK